MSRAWKWILGILAVLIVVALFVAGAFMWRNHAFWTAQPLVGVPPASGTPAPNAPQWKPGPYGFDDFRRNHMRDGGWGMPMMHQRGFLGSRAFSPFGLGFMILGGFLHLLLPLGILALVAYLFYQMGKRAGAAAGSSSSATRPPTPDSTPLPGRKVARR